MQVAGKGAVVNVSSVNGIRPAAFQGVYSITKGALITMTQAFAKEFGPTWYFASMRCCRDSRTLNLIGCVVRSEEISTWWSLKFP